MAETPAHMAEAVPAAMAPAVIELPAEPGEPRKRKPPRRRRARFVGIRFDEEEFARLDGRARDAGLTAGAYLRSCALGDAGPRAKRRVPVDREELARLSVAVGRVGNNVNQIAHALNSGGDVVPAEIVEAIGAVMETLGDIRRVMGRDRER